MKRSVSNIAELWGPLRILGLCKAAYEEPYIHDDDRLEHAALFSALYLGGFRINEALALARPMFVRQTSLEKREFLIVEFAPIEKSGGKMRNVALCMQDPLLAPLLAYLETLLPDEKLFTLTDRSALRIAGRISGGVAWNHWFRAQRDSWLATAFNKPERKLIIGWTSGSRKSFRDAEDRYAFLNWMWYADRLGRLTDSYWERQVMDQGTKDWLQKVKSLPMIKEEQEDTTMTKESAPTPVLP
jgi:hypothetical protein